MSSIHKNVLLSQINPPLVYGFSEEWKHGLRKRGIEAFWQQDWGLARKIVTSEEKLCPV